MVLRNGHHTHHRVRLRTDLLAGGDVTSGRLGLPSQTLGRVGDLHKAAHLRTRLPHAHRKQHLSGGRQSDWHWPTGATISHVTATCPPPRWGDTGGASGINRKITVILKCPLATAYQPIGVQTICQNKAASFTHPSAHRVPSRQGSEIVPEQTSCEFHTPLYPSCPIRLGFSSEAILEQTS